MTHTDRPEGKHAAPYSLAAENLAFFASWGEHERRRDCLFPTCIDPTHWPTDEDLAHYEAVDALARVIRPWTLCDDGQGFDHGSERAATAVLAAGYRLATPPGSVTP